MKPCVISPTILSVGVPSGPDEPLSVFLILFWVAEMKISSMIEVSKIETPLCLGGDNLFARWNHGFGERKPFSEASCIMWSWF